MDMLKSKVKDSEFEYYFQVVLGSPRARHTFFRRLNGVEDLLCGFKNKLILDVGCGYGFNIVHCAKKCKRTIGVDLDAKRIIFANEYAKHEGIRNSTFLCANAEELPFCDEIFDIVMGNEFLHHAIYPQKIINEMVRVAKKGGYVVISDHNRLSIPSELLRKAKFAENRCRTFTKKQVQSLFKKSNLKNIQAKYIIFTIPLRSVPLLLVKANSYLESFVEKIPILNTQCGVFIVTGRKR